MAASVSECLSSRILENSSKLSKNFAVMNQYSQMSGIRYFLRKVLNLTIYQ